MHLDALHAGFPLIHNSPYFADCGYYYEENDIYGGAEALLRAIRTHNSALDSYGQAARKCIWRFHTGNPENVLAWDTLLERVLSTSRSPRRQQQLEIFVADEAKRRGELGAYNVG